MGAMFGSNRDRVVDRTLPTDSYTCVLSSSVAVRRERNGCLWSLPSFLLYLKRWFSTQQPDPLGGSSRSFNQNLLKAFYLP